jgi:plastocyanin
VRLRDRVESAACTAALCALVATLLPACAGRFGPPAPGALEGAVVAAGDDAWVVLYLEQASQAGGETSPLAGTSDAAAAPPSAAAIRREAGGFSPPLLAVAPGQRVEFASADGIHHRFFSVSRPNAFELGIVRDGAPQRVVFAHPGVVRFYCSLHPGENGTIFVAPSPWFAAVHAPGPYTIRSVPPGRYRLRTWSEGHAPTARDVTVESGIAAPVEVALESGR